MPDVSCPLCGESFVSSANQAGLVLICKCGGLWRVPDEPAGGEGETRSISHFDEPDLQPCPYCRHVLPRASKLCVKCGYDFETGSTVRTETDQTVADSPMQRWAESREGKLKYFRAARMPLLMLAVGALVLIALVALNLGPRGGLTDVVIFLSSTSITYGVLFVVTLMLTPLLSENFGPIGHRLLVFGGLAVAMNALTWSVGGIVGCIGFALVWMLRPVLYSALFRYFFELEPLECLLVAMVVFAAEAGLWGAVFLLG